jgi:hypothetical protein
MRRSVRELSLPLLLSTLLLGCTQDNPATGEAEAQRDFCIGAPREEVIKHRASSGLVIMPDALPDHDEFLQAVVREIVSLGKARPTYYETFRVRATGNSCRDYVFYDGQRRVMYVARRRIG